jgi:hypothetical protein
MFQHLHTIYLYSCNVPLAWLTDEPSHSTLGCLGTLHEFVLISEDSVIECDSEGFFVKWFDEQTHVASPETFTSLGLMLMDPKSIGITARKLEATTELLRHHCTTLTSLLVATPREPYVMFLHRHLIFAKSLLRSFDTRITRSRC